MAEPAGTLLLTRAEVERLIDVGDCIEAIERAFAALAPNDPFAGVLGVPVPDGGFHVKAAVAPAPGSGGRPLFAAKVNANFPDNPLQLGRPAIQGLIMLFDAADGRPLAVLDSMAITSLRTAAASAVAAKFLARADAAVCTICGCGEQGRSHLRALVRVRPLRTVFAFDRDAERAARFAVEMARELGIEVRATTDLRAATRASDICVTCTPARRWLLGAADVSPGAFIAAVGADSRLKQEIEPALLASSTVVADVVEQCAAYGDLRHALDAGVMQLGDVYCELAEIVSGRRVGRRSETEVIVFDSTGTAIEDVAAATIAFERALASGAGTSIDFASTEPVHR